MHAGVQIGRPAVRALRAAAFTAICVLASAALHMLVGGTSIRPGALVVAVAATWTSAYALGSRQRGRPTLLALCGASQWGLHQLFAAGEQTASAMQAIPQSGHDHGTGFGMLLIHVAVALASSCWLARGESALACVLHLAAVGMTRYWRLLMAALAVPAGPPVTTRPRLTPAWPDTARRIPAALVRAVSRRGPPALRLCG
ncbi:hypothetical protein [Nonomuraea sp. NPDC049725]|uniref:hypothetical protein n=1 Tax=Nonomuraea sp. NPDC049725 TaxID=3154508 RepID=UPI00343A87CB